MDRIHTNEINRRKSFCARFEGHFLSALFGGLEEIPVLYTSKRAEPFDLDLPNVSNCGLTSFSEVVVP